MKKISILVRVYDRLEDLEICLKLIRENWKINDYEVIAISNGKSKGYILTESIRNNCDKIIELEKNDGHLLGNSQLLKEGVKQIRLDSSYVVILEADTWICDDKIISKYIEKMEKNNSVWASAEWIKKYWTLALDIAIIEKNFLINNKEILNFSIHPEAFVCNYLLDKKEKFIYIKEHMPVHRPNMIKRIYNGYGGRIREFPKAKMVTHHIEDLENGISTKKSIANEIFNKKYFDTGEKSRFSRKKIKFILFLIRICPNSSWFRRKKKRNL